MKKNIAFISLKSKYSKTLCKTFAQSLGMIFADIDDILQYNMVNQNMLETAGREYFDSEEQKVLKSVAECENICLNIDFVVINKNNNLQITKENCIVVYLQYPKSFFESKNKTKSNKMAKLLSAFELEDQICCTFADVVVKLNDTSKEGCNRIIKEIREYIYK